MRLPCIGCTFLGLCQGKLYEALLDCRLLQYYLDHREEPNIQQVLKDLYLERKETNAMPERRVYQRS